MEFDYMEQVFGVRGDVHIVMEDDTGILLEQHLKNVVTLDAGILAAILFSSKNSRDYGVTMLAVGTGSAGSATNVQRKLNAEIARKGFSSVSFRDGSGNESAIPTPVVDLTTTFGASEAVGPLTEMGLLSPISANTSVRNSNPNSYPTRDTTEDLSSYDILVNYLTFGTITKPATARLTITWRLTFGST